ncbi:MAG TPA: TolC family protein [Myxococcota bacterium]|nr:TolC family protein [Myxococcota bacterium]HRY96862.1 TolC family protein [Myxococcota bacterium]
MLTSLVFVVWITQAGPALDLAGCLREALERHPELAAAGLGVEQARTAVKGARAGYLPRLSAQVGEGYTWSGEREYQVGSTSQRMPGGSDDSHSMGLYLNQTLWDGGRYYLEPRRAEVELRRAETQVESSRADVAAEVVLAFLELQKALRTEAVLGDALQLSLGQLELATERRRLGDASRVDVSKAQVAVGEDRIALERQRAAVRAARVRLAVALGRPAGDAMEVAAFDSSTLAEEGAAAAPGEEHPRLRESRLLEEAAALDVDLATAGHWPKLTGSLSYSRQDPEFYKVYSRFDEIYNLSLGISMTVPLFEGFATQTAIESAEVRTEQVRADRRVLEQQLGAEAAQALTSLEALRAVHAIETENARAAEDSLQLAEERYKLGEGTALEVRDSQLAVTRARLSQVQTEFDLHLARARFHHARGDLLATYLREGER